MTKTTKSNSFGGFKLRGSRIEFPNGESFWCGPGEGDAKGSIVLVDEGIVFYKFPAGTRKMQIVFFLAGKLQGYREGVRKVIQHIDGPLRRFRRSARMPEP